MLKIVLIGADGMLGSDLARVLKNQPVDLVPLLFPAIDFCKPETVEAALNPLEFDVLINCAAYTRVDDCETHHDEATQINANGPAQLAQICKQKNARLVHFSTDYVFDGSKTEPYIETDTTNPLSIYGQTKLQAEQSIQASGCRYLIIRTSWLYGKNGPNFVRKMLELSETRSELKVVADQVGSPTYTDDLAQMTWTLVEKNVDGIVHVTNQDTCSWAQFAETIFLKTNRSTKVVPCSTSEYPTPARRPQNSRLENRRLKELEISLLRSWDAALSEYLSPPYIIFGAPLIEQAEIDEVVDSLKSGWIGTGPKVARFEADFKAYTQSPHAIAVSSCTAALHLALEVFDFPRGSEVITTAMTFCATANAILHAGCIPVLVDCEKDTMNISPQAIEKAITPKTCAIVPVHFAGRPCDMKAIMAIAKKHRLKVIEDCAHAIETKIDEQSAGTFGDLGCFSFYVTKNVVTAEGGMIITRDEEIAARIKILALHGMTKDAWKRFSDDGYKHYQVVEAGYKYNMTDLQAALGIHQLRRVEQNWKRRQQLWDRYQTELAALPLILPSLSRPQQNHAHHLYTILVDTDRMTLTRDALMMALHQQGIGTGVHYIALNLQPYYQHQLGVKVGACPNAEWISERTLSLPLSPKLTDAEQTRIIGALNGILNH
jgi:dTDP-4-dehydrorhamnose reductase